MVTNIETELYDFRGAMKKLLDNSENSYLFDEELVEYSEQNILRKDKRMPHLYRYTPADYYNIRGLEKQSLFLSKAGQMNDIFEGLNCETDDKIIAILQDLGDLMYMKSFSESKNCLYMWSRYADNYAGMCVEYDPNLWKESYKYHLFPVCYNEKRPHMKHDLKYIAQALKNFKYAIKNCNIPEEIDLLENILGLYLTKEKNWSQENEWRVLVSYLQKNYDLDDAKQLKLQEQTLDITNSIKSIYIGPKMENAKKEHLIEIGKKLGIPTVAMKLSETNYELVEQQGDKNI